MTVGKYPYYIKIIIILRINNYYSRKMKNSYLKAIEHTKQGMNRKVIFQIKKLTNENKELPTFHLFE